MPARSNACAFERVPVKIKTMRAYTGYIFDLDGTVYLGDRLIRTAGETIARLRTAGRRILFVSNNPTRTAAEYAAKLTRLGLATDQREVINSSAVLVDFLRLEMPGARLFVVGEAALAGELAAGGFELVEDARRVDAVIASFDRTFNYFKLQVAFDAIRSGARFFATNSDRFCPVPLAGGSGSVTGGEPDAAAVLAAIEACTGVHVETVVGKPSAWMAAAALTRLDLQAADCLITGDRLETDVQMGLAAGMDTALVLTGATSREAAARSSIQPAYVLERLSELLPA